MKILDYILQTNLYDAVLYCGNCHKHFTVSIEKGTTISDWVKENKKCPNCGCNTIVPSVGVA